jgi:CPA2 family monovalent cation:H+ antiporter-2
VEVLVDIIIIFTFNFIFLWIFSLLKITSIIGLFLAGFLIGPFGLKIIKNYETIEIVSEIGIILLLFTIGLEFSLKDLEKQKKDFFILGSLQIIFSILLSLIIFLNFYNLIESLIIGFMISLSSTAIILKILQDENQISSPYGKISVLILIFQDLVAIIYVMIIPYLTKLNNLNYFINFDINFLLSLFLKIVIFIISFYLMYKHIIPFLLYQIVRFKNKDLFVLSIITFCFLIAFGTYKLGLSLALGAFLAGLLISETPFSSETINNIVPFKIIFTSIFFTSIGMMVNLDFFITNYHWLKIIFYSVLFIITKFIVIFFIILIFHKNIRISMITSMYLSQIGEFSLIVLKLAHDQNLIDDATNQILLSSSILTMLLTPLIANYSHKITYKTTEILNSIYKFDLKEQTISINEKLKDHIIIVGFGINGRNVAKAAKIVDIPYIIIEMNIKTVLNEQKKGESIVYGDATNIHLLEQIGIRDAKLLVIVINDFKTTDHIIQIARKLNPNLHMIARTRYVAEVPQLYKSGANDVIPEEFETSIQIFRKILEHYNYSFPEIQFFMEELRISGYEILRRES